MHGLLTVVVHDSEQVVQVLLLNGLLNGSLGVL